MDDSDDYFTDDFVLDDNALAVLDQEEHKHTLSTQSLAVRHVPPPPKRQKTETGWRPGLGSRRTETLDDLDDLPEISVQGDGSYGLHARHAAIVSGTKTKVRSAGQPQPRSSSNTRNPLIRTASSSSLPSQQRRSPSVHPPRPPQRHASNTASSHSASIAPTTQSQSSYPSTSSLSEGQLEELRRQMEEV